MKNKGFYVQQRFFICNMPDSNLGNDFELKKLITVHFTTGSNI